MYAWWCNALKKIVCSLLVGALVLPALVFGAQPATTDPQPTCLSPKDSALFYAYVADKVRREYVEPTDNQKLLEGALDGMLTSLDKYSSYLSPEKYKEVKKQAHGEYGGLGLEIITEDGGLRIVSPIEDAPGQKAGLQTGDMIIAIDGKSVFEMSPHEAGQKMRGEPGSHVTLSIQRAKQPVFDVTMKRERVRVVSVKGKLKDHIAHLRVTIFNENTTQALRTQLEDFVRKEGDAFKGAVLDMRNNPGGLFDQAVSVCELFMEQGPIVSIRGRDPKKDLAFEAQERDILQGKPLVVLINGGSASAAEIVAGALQDNKRAVIVGTRSFGKASVQTVVPMTNGGAIKLTTAHYYTPSGRLIQKTGILPDITLNQEDPKQGAQDGKKDKRDAQLEGAMNVLKALSLGERVHPMEGGAREAL